MNTLVSRLADLAAWERAMLDECDVLLATNASMQVKISHLIKYQKIDNIGMNQNVAFIVSVFQLHHIPQFF